MAQGRRTIPFSKPTGFVQAPAGPSVEDARKAMLESAEAAKTYRLGEKVPQFIEEERAKAERIAGRGQGGNTPVKQEPVIEDVLETPPAPKTAAADRAPAVGTVEPIPDQPVIADSAIPEPVRVEAQPQPKEEDERERIETNEYIAEIYRDGRDWVGEITYKNGAGEERFTAPTIRELNRKLLEGKANATLKVRAEVRRRKFGYQLDTWDYFFDKLKQAHGITVDQFNALPEQSRELIKDTVQAVESEAFLADFPEFHRTPKNWVSLADWLNNEKAPVTQKNLGKAYYDLSENDLLEKPIVAKKVPQATIPAAVISAPVVSKTAEDSVVVAAASAAPQAPPVRKRGSSGIIPGQSSAVTSATVTEEDKPREPSREELRTMDIKEDRKSVV